MRHDNRLHSSRPIMVNLLENTAGILTYDKRKELVSAERAAFSESPKRSNGIITLHFVKYSNGGCSGFEPDSLLHLLS